MRGVIRQVDPHTASWTRWISLPQTRLTEPTPLVLAARHHCSSPKHTAEPPR